MKTLLYGLLVTVSPVNGWRKIAEHGAGMGELLALHTIPYSLIPAVCWYVGVTQQGWEVAGEPVQLTAASALPMCVMFFFAMVFGILFLGYMVKWMAVSYGSGASLAKSTALISYTGSPFFVAGLLGLYPVIWFDILVGCLIACYCIYLLYRGTSVMLDVPPERGFLYASAVFAVALVSFVALLGATVILWDFGPAPEYTYAPAP